LTADAVPKWEESCRDLLAEGCQYLLPALSGEGEVLGDGWK